MGIVLIIAGAICLALGVILLVNKQQSVERIVEIRTQPTNSNNVTLNSSFPQPNRQSSETPSIPSDKSAREVIERPASNNEETKEDSHRKGEEFEKYIVSRFGKKYWTIKDWRGDKSSKGRYAESSTYPDLEMNLTLRGQEYVVAVECKYRSKSNDTDEIKWSYPEQMKRYQEYEKSTGIPVFVAIGVGGSPSAPANLFIVPLRSLSSHKVSLSQLKAYDHDLAKQLFYDTDTKTLR